MVRSSRSRIQVPAAVLRWEQPPTKGLVPEQWQGVADQLRDAPQQWAVIFEGPGNQCAQVVQLVKKGTGPFAPAGSFEATSRDDAKVYARYVAESPAGP